MNRPLTDLTVLGDLTRTCSRCYQRYCRELGACPVCANPEFCLFVPVPEREPKQGELFA